MKIVLSFCFMACFWPIHTLFATTNCVQEFIFFGLVGDVFWIGENISGECITSYLHQVHINDSSNELISSSLEECNDWTWLKSGISCMNLEKSIRAKRLTAGWQIEDFTIKNPVSNQRLLDSFLVDCNILEWNEKEGIKGIVLPQIKNRKTQLLYTYPYGLYIDYEINNVYYFPDSKYLLIFTHQPITASGADTLHGFIILRVLETVENTTKKNIFNMLKYITPVSVLFFGETYRETLGEVLDILKGHHDISDKQNLAFTDYKINGYIYRLLHDKESGDKYFEILHNEEKVFTSEMGMSYEINPGDATGNLPLPGKDITGDGIPDLVVEGYSGGAHCCNDYLIFSLGEQFQKIAHLYGGDSSFEFKDIDGDGVYEIIGRDWTFAYWETSFAASPAPEIILYYKDNKYKLACGLMRESHPEFMDKFDKKLEMIKSDPAWTDEVPSSLWGYMLDLIFTGNSKKAYEFFDRAWQGDKEGKKKFIRKFKTQLSKSPYWHKIRKMNRKWDCG